MKREKGFTLIEILAVVTIIGLIFILVIPKITTSLKNKKGDVDRTIENMILSATKLYVSEHSSRFEKTDGNVSCMPLHQLVKIGYLEGPVKNVTDDKDITNGWSVKITYDKGFEYELVDSKECSVVYKLPCKYDYCDSDGNGYNKVEYLESNGNPYINTGIYPKSTTKIDVEFSLADYPQSNSWWVNGWGSSGYQESFKWGISGGKWMFSVSSNTEETFLDVPIDLKKHNIHLESGSQKFDNVEYATNIIGNTATNKQMIYLFALNAEWVNGATAYMPEKIHSIKIYDQNSICRNYIPVLDKNSRPCLYDKVEKKCYYNQGTGEFLWG